MNKLLLWLLLLPRSKLAVFLITLEAISCSSKVRIDAI